MQDDPLFPWKKHSGFKKGLLTDIVMGDEHMSKSKYETTMNSDYVPKRISNNQKIAGRSSGFVISDPSQKHISFGDGNLVSSEHQESVTESAYKAPDVDYLKKETSIRLAHHSKPLTATAAAHVGQQTRQDLPIDDHFFKLFTTTTEKAYRVHNDDSKYPRQIFGGRKSQLVFGDQSSQLSYNTTQSTSFVKHSQSDFGPHAKYKPKITDIFSTKHEITPRSHFTTTLSSTYQGKQIPPEDRQYVPNVSQKNGSSHIHFGQDAYEVENDLSVTKSDFSFKKLDSPVKSIKSGKPEGILKAMAPSTELNMKSYSEACYKPPVITNKAAAGLPTQCFGRNPCEPLTLEHTFHSAVPTGDQLYFDFAHANTTSKGDFKEYTLTSPPSHPPLGYNITKSKVFAKDTECTTDYVTSSHSEFIPYTSTEAKLTRGIPINPYRTSHRIGSDDTFDVRTAHQDDFKNPKINCKRLPKLPHLAQVNKLFPLAKDQMKKYETTMEEYYGVRKGLYFNKDGTVATK
ncbi:hypothetical protein HK103_006143 [Boothiomyces macroporosus]|uniref:Uncharacterized protein n=1 Tax=Boothiomyces macroporosus TaxID=261099 RepID=A0AAD5Y2T5_9FUNG|nr:hypothetical protein HK103_006143 [Boothiomyces macroporosus]